MSTKQNAKFQELVVKLREIFQIDRPELDFGIYRILNARASEINDYLENRLAEKVQAALAAGSTASAQHLRAELQEAEKNAYALGVSPDGVPKVQELRARLQEATTGTSEHENSVFSHLLTFFSRYYDNGDFISQRRYKGDTYAVPYAGEEVMLYWANKDQYYTKSGETFTNYSFRLEDGRTIHFRLVAADTAKDNRKDDDKERRFTLAEKRVVTRTDERGAEYEEKLIPVEEVDGASGKELIIRFEYRPVAKGIKQDALVEKAVQTVLADAAVKTRWLDLGKRVPTEKNPQRTLLEKHLTDYTTKNTADYFIHKDLNGFLRRELDFYIKNEVLHLDDVQNAGAFADVEKNLRMLQCLRIIALELIAFLAQLEDFLKKLWLKKKFVVSSEYCVTVDRVPEELYPEIAGNAKQWRQWHLLGMRTSSEAGTLEDLKTSPYLMIDTELFPRGFKARLLQAMPDLDLGVDGILICGDNFQALRLMSTRYADQVRCIYIDPPYNTGQDGFLYKDRFKSSSWASMIGDRLRVSRHLLSTDGVIFSSIDKRERDALVWQFRNAFGAENFIEELIWTQDTVSNNAPTYSANHEYIEAFAKDLPTVEASRSMFRETRPGFREVMEIVDELGSRCAPVDEIEEAVKTLYREHQLAHRLESESLGISAEEAKKADPWKGIYPYTHVEYRDARGRLVAYGQAEECGARPWVWREVEPSMPSAKQSPTTRDPEHPNYRFYTPPHPMTGRPCKAPKRGWAFPHHPLDGRQSYDDYVSDNRLHFKGEDTIPQLKYFLHEVESVVATSVIRQYADGEPRLEALFNQKGLIQNPKPPALIERLIRQTTDRNSLIADFFAGSGTTAHAVIAVNRGDHGRRKYLLVEQGGYFDSVTKPRVQKVVFSQDWEQGLPSSRDSGVSHCYKVLRLESYEDTLNNLQLNRAVGQDDLFATLPQQAKDDYLLRYMLNVESRGSLLSVEDFKRPFDYKMNIAVDSAGAYEPRKVDLVETFNYLIGLTVKHIDAQPERGFVTVTGTLPSGETCLVLWRDCEILDYEGISRLCDKLAINPADNEFDVVYINGDHNIPTVLTQTQEEGGATRVLKLRQIEPEFLSHMFSVEDI
ncbi:TPA: site-specific DNA-methyltransferase [Burkholderia vietnamiensis]|nr:site-specific DNA-methyltransferase [Burkholderia vietnamiensis]